MTVLLLVKRGQDHQIEAMNALQIGLAKHGIYSEIAHAYEPDPVLSGEWDFVATWGHKFTVNQPQLVLEAGYINGQSGNYVKDRLQFVSAGWSGLHGRADPGRLGCPPDRWSDLDLMLLPWHESGEYVLVCDQHPGDSCAPQDRRWWHHVNDYYAGWCDVIYRPHPLLAGESLQPLCAALRGARACYTWNSTAGIEAVIAGVPTWALDAGSMVREVAAHRIGDKPRLVEREQWAYDLAYRQWTHDELASGEAWETLQHGLPTNH